MPQSGGPTTESGILFQNSVASLFLGDLLQPIQKLPRQTVTHVRIEAPVAVDDTVVTYADGHRVFIQAKESLRIQLSKTELRSDDENEDDLQPDELSDDAEEEDADNANKRAQPKKVAWVKLWQDFESQFFDSDFRPNQDRLCLYLGHITGPLEQLRELCASAWGANDASDWFDNLPKEQKELVELKIRPLLKDEHRVLKSLWELLRHLDVEVDSFRRIENYLAPLRMPNARYRNEDYNSANLFDTLLAECARNAPIRKQFDAPSLRELLRSKEIEIESFPAIERLREEVKGANAVLLGQRVTIGQKGEHLPRQVTEQIVKWLIRGWKTALNKEDEANIEVAPPLTEDELGEVGILHDTAGMGKTVVMHDVLNTLQGIVPVIAIKTDSQLLKLKQGQPLEKCLGFSQSLPRLAYRLAQDADGCGVVVLLDQVDALSMALARDDDALEKVVALVDQLRAIPGVRVLISCRSFDLYTDPTLKKLPRKTEFSLGLFSTDETEARLKAINVEADSLSLATRELLRVPLHLDLLALALEHQPERLHNDTLKPRLGGLRTLQDLHALLWENVIEDERLPPDEISRRVETVNLLAESISKSSKLTVPSEVFTSPQNARLRPAALALASAGLLVNEKQGWHFWHQTFFDYASARGFVARGDSLSHSILNGDQGLSERPRMLQILTYLRGRDTGAYAQEIATLFKSPQLADHLGDLLIRWFGALNDPDGVDWEIAQVLLQENTLRIEFIQRAEVSCGWFSYLQEEVFSELFEIDDPSDNLLSSGEIAGRQYLLAMLNQTDCQAETARFLTPFIDRSKRWNHHLAWLLALVLEWNSDEAIACYKEICMRWLEGKINGDFALLEELPRIAKSPCTNAPTVICDILRLWFQQILDDFNRSWSASKLTSNNDDKVDTLEDDEDDTAVTERLERLLESMRAPEPKPFDAFKDQNFNYILGDSLEATAKREPEYFLAFIVPVIERVMKWTHSSPRFGYPHDPLFLVSCHDVGGHRYRSTECLIRDSCLVACQSLQAKPEKLRPFIQRLRALPFSSPQALVASIYRVAPQVFAMEAAEFLIEDERRLWLGFGSQIDSALLLRAIFPFLDETTRHRVEQAIEKFEVIGHWKSGDSSDLDLLRYRGTGQLRLLLSIDRAFLSPQAIKLLEELIRKHPQMNGYAPQEEDNVASYVTIGSDDELFEESTPVSTVSLSDEDWVRIIQRRTSRELRIKERVRAIIRAKSKQKNEADSAKTESTHVAEEEENLSFDLEDFGSPNEDYMIAQQNLKPAIAAEPERFADLAINELPPETEADFAINLIESLADSSLPTDRVFQVICHFEPPVDWPVPRFWQSVRKVIELRGQNGVPTDVVEMLERHLRLFDSSHETGDETIRFVRPTPPPALRRRRNRRDPFAPAVEVPPAPDAEDEDEFDESTWINMGPMVEFISWSPVSDIWNALLFSLEANETTLATSNPEVSQRCQQRRWELIEETVNHPGKVMRYAGLVALLPLFRVDRLRAFAIYEKLVEGYPDLLAMLYSAEVLRYAIVWFYHRALPYINELLNDKRAALAQRGATLVTIAAWHSFDRGRPARLIQGRPAWRRGVAKVWAERALATDATAANQQWCREGIISLLPDTDPFVQRRLALLTRNLKGIHWNDWHPFLQGLLQSPALPECFDALTNYLWEYGKSRRSAVLPIIEAICDDPQGKELGLHGYGGEDLVRCVLNVYNSPLTSLDDKKRCISLFGRLLKQFPGDGNRALNEWDKSHFTWG